MCYRPGKDAEQEKKNVINYSHKKNARDVEIGNKKKTRPSYKCQVTFSTKVKRQTCLLKHTITLFVGGFLHQTSLLSLISNKLLHLLSLQFLVHPNFKNETPKIHVFMCNVVVFPSAVHFLGSMHECKKIFFILYSFSVVFFFFFFVFLSCSDIRQNVYAYMQMWPNHSVLQNVSDSIFNVEFKKLTRL